MGNYIFRFYSGGKLAGDEVNELSDDLAALDLAKALATDYEVEVWSDERFVARVKENDAALDAGDRNGG